MMERLILPEHTFAAVSLMSDVGVDTHWHKDIEVLYTIKGSVTCNIETEKILLAAGDILFISSLVRHKLASGRDTLAFGVHLNYDMAKAYLKPRRNEGWRKFASQLPETIKLQKLLNQILTLHMAEERNKELLQQGAGYELLYYLLEIFGDTEEKCSEEEDRKQQILRYILDNYRDQIQLPDLAEELGLSAVYLSRMFKKAFGIGFLRFLTQFRLNEAKRALLRHPDYSVLRIAMDNGFPNLQSFNKAFRETYGETPSKYRANALESAEELQDAGKAKEQARQYLSSLQPELGGDMGQMGTCEVICLGTNIKQYRKIWSKAINVGRLSSLQQSDMQNHVLSLKKDLRFEYVRLWDIYSEELLLDLADYKDYDFSRMDRIFDFLTEHEIKPYLDLGLKPYLMLQGKGRPLIEKNITYEPGTKIPLFVEKFMRHYRHRYGEDELGTWYFEFWFDFRSRTAESESQYLRNLQTCRSIIKKFAPKAKLGGMGDGTENLNGRLMQALEQWDFLSVYSYPYDASLPLDEGKRTQQEEMLENRIRGAEAVLAGTGEKKELHVSEWSLSVSNRNIVNDSVFKGAYIVKTCLGACASQANALIYWVSSDLYAEFKDTSKLLFGGTGLVSKNGIRKPAYYAFYFLSRLGKYLVHRNEHAIVTTNNNGAYRILCHNCKSLSPKYFYTSEEDLDADKMQEYFLDGDELTVRFQISNVEDGVYTIKSQYVNEDYGNVQAEYRRLRDQGELTKDDIAYLKNICVPHIEVVKGKATGGRLSFEVSLKPNEFRYIRCELTHL